MPAGLGDILAYFGAKANAYTLRESANKDAETVAMALAKIVGHEGVWYAHAEQGEAFDAVDAEHVDLACLDHVGVQVQGAPLEEELIGVDYPLAWPITAIVHDAQTLVLLAGIPEVVQDGSAAAKAILQDDVIK